MVANISLCYFTFYYWWGWGGGRGGETECLATAAVKGPTVPATDDEERLWSIAGMITDRDCWQYLERH